MDFEQDIDRWVFHETVHPRGRFEIVAQEVRPNKRTAIPAGNLGPGYGFEQSGEAAG